MKKINLTFTIPSILLLAAVLFSSCSKEEAVEKAAEIPVQKNEVALQNSPEPATEIIFEESLVLETDENNAVTFDSVQKYFSPTFNKQSSEDIQKAQKASKSAGKTSAEKSESVISGIRPSFSDYATNYKTVRSSSPYNAPFMEEDEFIDYDRPFIISDWGPQAKIVSESEFPSFYVVFSQPVHALSALEEPSSYSSEMSVSPALKGVFRWYGTRHLAFEAEEAADPSQVYTISVSPNLKSLAGNKITGKTTFTTKAQDISILNIWGGYIKDSDQAYEWSTGAQPPYDNRFLIRLNYPVTSQQLLDVLNVSVGNQKVSYSLQPDYNPDTFRWWNTPKFDEKKGKTNTYLVTIKDKIPFNETVSAWIKTSPNNKSSYETLRPFIDNQWSDTTGHSTGSKSHPLRIYFSQAIDASTVPDNISFDFNFKLKENENFEVNSSCLTIFNMPVDFDESHYYKVSRGLKDVYGQNYSGSTYANYFKVLPATSYANFLDSGTKMMEAQFPHKLLFEYQNIEPGSYYELSELENPFKTDYSELSSSNLKRSANSTLIPQKEKNRRHFTELDLNPLLNNGFGFLQFKAAIKTKQWNWWKEAMEIQDSKNILNLQVTDLGLTTRLAMNKAVVMVRKLSDGQPVSDATVMIFGPDTNKLITENLTEENSFAYGKTDSNGVCVINFNQQQVEAITEQNYYAKWAVMAVSGDDKAIYIPNSHSPWRDGVYTESKQGIRNPKQRTFMFVDRGIYRPGETVTFKGIDRDQLLGTLKTKTGSYKITSQGNWWKASDIIEPITGELSENGGFYGSFKIPEDTAPGTYCISYSRLPDSNYTEKIFYTVAEFERVKIESSIETPDITFFGGDKISSTLSADYLAGGVLSNAQYDTTWYKQPANFSPETPDAEGYSFGPENFYGSRTQYSQDSGKLNSSGMANLSCNTESITDGNPYIYRVEAGVTDISNQRISTNSSIFVHPSQFYAGVRFPDNMSGFAKVNQKLDFPYILVDTQGNKLTDTKSIVSELEFTLTREEWTMVHEQSVYNSIYTRYERTSIEEQNDSLKIDSASGKISITPENSGLYTLTIKGKDTKDRPVITTYGFYVTGGQNFWYNSNNSESITLTPSQSQYNPGDTAQILLQSPLPSGDYLITVEREGIFTEEVKHFDSPANVIEVPVSKTYVPVVYVSVSSYSVRTGEPTHNYGEVDLDKPKGYYGVTPLFINPYVRAFSVQIDYDKPSYKPGETATVTLTATKGGKPYSNAEITLLAVDRGVLDLIDYHVPNPINYFYKTENFPLYVSGGDSRALLMDPVTYALKDLAGGDAADEEKEDERKDFRPTAVFEPSLITDENGKVTCSFKLPDSLTTYRVTAFGVKDDLFSLQESEVRVQNPINIQAVQPRKLRERDTAECGVLITNLDKNGQNITVSLQTRSPAKNTAEDDKEGRKTIPGSAFVDGNSEYTVYVASNDSSVVYFDVAAEKQGSVELVYTINSDLIKEKLVSSIQIEKPYIYETVTLTGQTESSATEQIIIPGFAEDSKGSLNFTLDATRLGALGSSVNYLFEYPYGCLEQQSSQVLPLLLFEDYIDVFNLDSKVADIHKCVTTFTQNWKNSQHSSGGFPYWPDSSYDSLYVSIRIAHICAIALKHGYTVDELGINLSSLLNFIARNVSTEIPDGTLAYATYVFQLLGSSVLDYELGYLSYWYDDLTFTDQAYTALALLERDDDYDYSLASEIALNLRSYLVPVERSVTLLNKDNNNYNWWWYESEDSQLALILKLFSSLNPDDEMVDRLLFTLMQKQSQGYWKNTLTTAKVLDAITTYIQARNLESTDYTAEAKLNDKGIMQEEFKGVNAKPKTFSLDFSDKQVSSLKKDIYIPLNFSKTGDGELYYTVEMKYALPGEMQSERNEGLKVEYKITDYETGAEILPESSESTVLKLESGKLYKATIRLESHRDRTFVALRAPVPCGAEILDSTLATTGSEAEMGFEGGWGQILSNTAIRDTEVQYFWDSYRTGSATVSFTFRTNRRGVYSLPPAQAECMYEPEIFGRSNGYLAVIE